MDLKIHSKGMSTFGPENGRQGFLIEVSNVDENELFEQLDVRKIKEHFGLKDRYDSTPYDMVYNP